MKTETETEETRRGMQSLSAITATADRLVALRRSQTAKLESVLRAARSSSALIATSYPRLDAFAPHGRDDPELIRVLSTHTLEELAGWETRLAECERCPPTGGACTRSPEPKPAPGEQPRWRGEYLSGVPCARWEGYQRLRYLAGIGVPEPMLGCRFENFSPRSAGAESALGSARGLVQTIRERSLGLIFCGAPGSGKTHLAVAILAALAAMPRRERPAKGIWVKFLDASWFLHRSKQDIGGERDGDLFDRALESHVLVLDDIARVRVTDWSSDCLSLLSSRRLDAGRPTILTTSDSKKFERLFGALAPRLVRSLEVVMLDA